MHPAIQALLVCLGAAALEGALTGSGVRARFAELRQPRLSAPLPLWFVIGGVYYVICFVLLYRLLGSGLPTSGHRIALVLLLLLMLANAVWGWVFFRRKNLRASFWAFLPYPVLAAALEVLLVGRDLTAALWFVPYLLYLPYGIWWSYKLWVMNRSAAS